MNLLKKVLIALIVAAIIWFAVKLKTTDWSVVHLTKDTMNHLRAYRGQSSTCPAAAHATAAAHSGAGRDTFDLAPLRSFGEENFAGGPAEGFEGTKQDEHRIAAGQFAEDITASLDPEILASQRKYAKSYDDTKTPNSAGRIMKKQITEPSLGPGAFIGWYRPQAVPQQGDPMQDLDIPAGVLANSSRHRIV